MTCVEDNDNIDLNRNVTVTSNPATVSYSRTAGWSLMGITVAGLEEGESSLAFNAVTSSSVRTVPETSALALLGIAIAGMGAVEPPPASSPEPEAVANKKARFRPRLFVAAVRSCAARARSPQANKVRVGPQAGGFEAPARGAFDCPGPRPLRGRAGGNQAYLLARAPDFSSNSPRLAGLGGLGELLHDGAQDLLRFGALFALEQDGWPHASGSRVGRERVRRFADQVVRPEAVAAFERQHGQ